MALEIPTLHPQGDYPSIASLAHDRDVRFTTSKADSPGSKYGWRQRHEARSHVKRAEGFLRILSRLSEKSLPDKAHIEQYLREKYRHNCSLSTVSNALRCIECFGIYMNKAGKAHFEEIDRRDLGAFIEHEQDRGLAATSVRNCFDNLKVFLRFLAERGVVRAEVLLKRIILKVPSSLPRAMEFDDEQQLLSVIDEARDRAMILVLLRTGMRIGELLNTLVSDINIKERRIDIWEAQKNRVGRVVYLSGDAVSALKGWFKKREAGRDFVFYGRGNTALSYSAARIRFMKYIDKAGLSHKGYTLHCLRHTNASELLNAGMPLECVKELLGHSSVEMTRRYAKLTNRTREKEYFKAMEKIQRGESNGYYRVDLELQEILKENELLASHGEELHEHP
jgi:integrase/recombinase XerD